MKIYKRYFWFTLFIDCGFLFIWMILLTACSTSKKPSIVPAQHAKNMAPDYSNLQYWAAHPWKMDTADSVPAALKNNYFPDSIADVFFIHPTTLTDHDDTSWNAAIDDAAINLKTDKSSILYQASVFNESCRIFAPRYRQAHLKAFFISKEASVKYFDLAYADVRAAFDHYLLHYNTGRPIIIASHSQGTLHAGRLLKEYFEGSPLEQQLVCAYIIGMPIPDNYFSSLKPCTDSLATGCFVGWRTYKSGYEPDFVKEESFRSVVVNPLTWTLGEELAPASLNKGGILKDFDKLIPNVVSAKVHNNVLWTSKPDFFGKIFLKNKNYHIGDINLFYMNIRENIKARIKSHLIKKN